MDFKLMGSILLIVGTSIGAGMLALPIATAELGFIGSLILLFICWSVMTAGAFLLLEANLWMPLNSNLISMAKATIGPSGQILSWVVYLLLLYSLLCAYIAGGSDLFQHLLLSAGIQLSAFTSAVIFIALFGTIVYLGIKAVDYVNRGLMFIKLGAYLLLVCLLTPFISFENLAVGDFKQMTSAIAVTVTITSFGYATIVPSLRIYFAGNIKKLKIAIFVGSLIPLICYIFWDAAIMGVIPLEGAQSLTAILKSKNSTSELVSTLNTVAPGGMVTFFVKLFTSFCVVTSFLGVALCLTDFMADGLQVEKKGVTNLFIHALVFLPPLLIVLFFPNMFIRALQYAGIYSVILLILLPAWMVWKGRYHRKIANGYQVAGGKPLLAFLIIFSLLVIIQAILHGGA